ncbi:nitroreductase family protein [Variovorax defluvii]|uniref:Nitroreductase family protein n=1 Tax=Variovorax defluvii TaxID=913761 RepID=A0ABP8I8U8_9BURK
MSIVLEHPDTAAVDRAGLARAVQLIEARQSVRRYAEQDIDDDVLAQLLHCATRAPSAHNRQPWRFAVLRHDGAKATLAAAMGDRLRRDRLADGDGHAEIDADVARSAARITGAPVVILVASSLADMDAYPDERRRTAEAAMAMQSTAMAVQNLLLAASAAGLGACWMCAPLFCPDTARRALAIPLDWQPQALVTLGIPHGPVKRRPRRGMREVVRQEVKP